MESILTTIKKLLGIEAEYTHFDADIIMNINSVFMTLYQMGVGPSRPAAITSDIQTWESIYGEDIALIETVKTYIYHKVKLSFDPPTSSSHMEALKALIQEDEWRLSIQKDLIKKEG